MNGISDIKICGIDQSRPPKILKSPYIDLVFELTHQAPKEWCEDFNVLGGKREFKAKIDPAVGLYVETWVRKTEEVEKAFLAMKDMVDTCSNEYIARAKAKAGIREDSGPVAIVTEEQEALNKVVAGLEFDSKLETEEKAPRVALS